MNKGTMKWGLIGLGVGIAAGAVAATLLAPKSGKETRADIAKQAIKAKDVVVVKVTPKKKAKKSTKK